MTAALITIAILAAVCAVLAWRAWSGWRRREREADAAARAFAEGKAREAVVVEQAQRVEAATVADVEARRVEALSGDRDAVVAEALRRARARYGTEKK